MELSRSLLKFTERGGRASDPQFTAARGIATERPPSGRSILSPMVAPAFAAMVATTAHAARSSAIPAPRAVTSVPNSPWRLMRRKPAARSRPSPSQRRRMSPSRRWSSRVWRGLPLEPSTDRRTRGRRRRPPLRPPARRAGTATASIEPAGALDPLAVLHAGHQHLIDARARASRRLRLGSRPSASPTPHTPALKNARRQFGHCLSSKKAAATA